MTPLRVLFVDDEYEWISAVKILLDGTNMFRTEYSPDYAALDAETVVDEYDVLVLDVFMEKRDSNPFHHFVERLDGCVPFYAYTILETPEDTEAEASSPDEAIELGEFVFEKGGLGIVTKGEHRERAFNVPSIRDYEYALVERLMQCYWMLPRHGHAS